MDRDQVVHAARSRIVRHGLTSLTMRKLAADLGVTPMALYRHVDGRDDLLEAVIDEALEELRPVDVAAPLHEQLRHLDDRMRAAFGDLPELALLLVRSGPSTDRSVAFINAAVEGLIAAGLDRQAAAVTYATLSTLALARIALPSAATREPAAHAELPHLAATFGLLVRSGVPTVDLIRETASALEQLDRVGDVSVVLASLASHSLDGPENVEPRGVPCGRGLGEFSHSIAGMSPSQPGLPALEAVLSAARLRPYLDACDGDASAAVALYEWNIGVSAAFREVIVVTEVAMRNAMHDRLSDAYGQNWYDDQSILDDRSLKAIREAKRRAARGLPAGATPTPGKVVSEMSFGVWVALLDRGGRSTAVGRRLLYHDTLWLPALQDAFPAGPGHQRRTNRGLRIVQSLRNRIGHHEKIFKEPFEDTHLTLADLHDHCIDVTGWISADAATWATRISRVPELLARRPSSA